uniref:C2H2-type domain-containing protein n=2 Tax=Xenopus tropicalis TaxID=8364 RepID=A0A6I8Q039_XENTR
MGNEDTDPWNERFLQLTLEIIYLLTGEGYIVMKKSGDGMPLPQNCTDCMLGGACRRHVTPPTVGGAPRKENDKKILELISNIMHLLTGEVLEYLKRDKALYWERIKEDHRQLRPLDGEYEDKREIPADLGGTLCYNNEPSKIGAEGADFCADGNPTNPEISQMGQPPPANGIKEEGENQSDCSINPLTGQIQGTDTPCSLNNSLADNYVSNYNEEKCLLFERGDHTYCSRNPLTQQTEEANNHIMAVIVSNGSKGASLPSPPAVYNCNECAKGFPRKRSLVRHQRTHTGEKPYFCSECGKCFTQRSYLHIHQRSHTGNDLFSCPECGKCFTLLKTLHVHQRIHTGEKPFSCPECDASFSRRPQLIAHQRRHSGENLFICFECGKCFRSRSILNEHQRIHTGEKPFTCSECGRSFTQRSSLIVHRQSHSARKPFPCSECGKCFTMRAYLAAHLQSHTGEKPFSCSECGKCFTRRSNLNVHHRTHTGEKPFSCSECGKLFTRRSNLILHHKLHM